MISIVPIEAIFNLIDDDEDVDEQVSEWFTRFITSQLNLINEIYFSFENKEKLLALIKNILEISLQNSKDPFSTSTLD